MIVRKFLFQARRVGSHFARRHGGSNPANLNRRMRDDEDKKLLRLVSSPD